MKSETVSLVRRGTVSLLVVTLALPVGLLAQRGGIPVPRSPKLPPGIFQPVEDPLVSAVTSDMIANLKDARAHGATPDHMRRHAANIRQLAKRAATNGTDEQVKAWAQTQDPDVFQLQPIDPQVAETLAAQIRAQGFSPDAIGQAVNASPEQKRQVLLLLREKGLSGFLADLATLIETATGPVTRQAGQIQQYNQRAPGTVMHQPPAQWYEVPLSTCQKIGVASSFAAIGAMVAPVTAPVLSWVSLGLGLYNVFGCPGLGSYVPEVVITERRWAL